MSTKQIVVVSIAFAALGAGIATVVTSRMSADETGGGTIRLGARSLDLDRVVEHLDDARLDANEAAAIATLRALTSAEAVTMDAVLIDIDGDGAGEYAYLGEMAGTAPLRGGTDVAVPEILSASLGAVSAKGVATKNGYHLRVFLPGAPAGRRYPGLAEGDRHAPDADAAEVLWCAYAWPVDAGTTGMRVFFVNQEGDLLETANADHAYSSEARGPKFDAAFSSESPRDMGTRTAIEGRSANDGRHWSIVGD